MDKIIWVMYFADIIDNLSATLSVIAILLILIGVVSSIVCLMGYGTDDMEKSTLVKCLIYNKKFFITSICLVIVLNLVPSKKTVYVYAGSIATQEIVKSNEGQKVIKIVNKKLDEYLAESENVKPIKN